MTNKYCVMGQIFIVAGDITPDVVGRVTAASTLLTVTGAGHFHIWMASGTTGTVTSGTATVTGSVVTLAAGDNAIAVEGAGNCTLALTIGTAANTNTVNTWSLASGGKCGADIPSSTDNTYFDANSFTAGSQVLTADATFNSLAFDWTGATNNPTLAFPASRVFYCYGNVTFIAAMTVTGGGNYGTLYLRPALGVTATLTAPSSISSLSVDAYGDPHATTPGIVSLATSLTCRAVTVERGTFLSNNYNINCDSSAFSIIGGASIKTVTLGTSTVTTFGSWTVTGTSITFTHSGTINCGLNFTGGTLAYNIVNLTGATSTIAGNNSFVQLNLDSGTTQTITFTDSSTQTITTPSLNGSSTKVHTIKGSSTGGWAIVKAGGGVVRSEYMDIQYSNASPASTWIYGVNSVIANSTGWIKGLRLYNANCLKVYGVTPVKIYNV